MTDEHEHDRIALIDIDDTLAAFTASMRAALEKIRSPGEPPWSERYEDDEPAWLEQRMRLIKSQPGFWRELPTIPIGMQVYDLLGRLRYRRMILTKGPKTNTPAWTEKADWCARHVPAAGLLVVRSDADDGPHKGLVYAKVLFDDHPPYIMQWLKWRPRGHVILLDNPTNRWFSHPNVLRVFGEDKATVGSQLGNVERFLERPIERAPEA